IIEKPVTLDADEAAELFALAAERGLLAFVWHNRRFDADYRAVRQLIRERGAGELLRVENRTFSVQPALRFGTADFDPSWRISSDMGGGTLWDFGPHWVDQVLDLVPGTVVGVLAQVRNVKWGTAEDCYHITMLFDSGVHAVASKIDIAHHGFPKWLIYGSEATIWSAAGVNSPVHWKSGEKEVVLEDPEPAPDMLANVQAVIRDGAEPLITPAQALRTARILDAARASAAQGRQIDVNI
ncbi:MAG: Gfo/Idh/MocA family protein, partial [Planctomycetota bacterium]